MVKANSDFEIVTGKNQKDEHVMSVIAKRSYSIDDAGELTEIPLGHDLRKIDVYYDGGDPEWSVVQHESELAAFKPLVDLVVIGHAYAPGGDPVPFMRVGVEVGGRAKELLIVGDRRCQFRSNADPIVSGPEPFSKMEIRYDLAYGGRDEVSDASLPLFYPRNFMGKGVALRNTRESVDNLALPNIEDPNDRLTPERIIIGEPERWHLQPIPQGFGWRQKSWYPRSALLGSFPAFTEVGTVTAEERMGLLPKNHVALAKQFRLPTFEADFNNGASLGLSFKELVAGEAIILRGLTPNGFLRLALPDGIPNIAIDLGQGKEELKSRLHTVSIRPDDMEVDLIWRGCRTYDGYGFLAKLERLHATVH